MLAAAATFPAASNLAASKIRLQSSRLVRGSSLDQYMFNWAGLDATERESQMLPLAVQLLDVSKVFQVVNQNVDRLY